MHEQSKSQTVRLLDIIAFGPFMIYAASQKKIPGWVRLGLVVLGLATINYNAKNYLANIGKE